MNPTTRLLVALAVASSAACSRSEDGAAAPDGGDALARSALLVTLDTTRWDALSTTGAPPGVTPALDALAAESIQFLQARTTAPLTAPAHASMLTGLIPPRHGVRDNGSARLPAAAVTLAERLREAGCATAAFVAAAVLDARYGLDQGFDRYDDLERPAGAEGQHFLERDAAAVVEAARTWLAGLPAERPFFLWVHLFDPHAPYAPPPEFLERAGGHAYLGEVAYADHHVGRLLAELRALGRDAETLVVVVADHGEGLGQHGEGTHASLAYDSTVRVPLLVRRPDRRHAGTRAEGIASVVDVFPTVLAALGLDPAAGVAGGVDGSSLLAPQVPAGRGAYFETYYGHLHFGWSPVAGWADARGKYVHSSAPLLFRTDRDPQENAPAAAPAEELAAYRRALEAAVARPALEPERAAADASAAAELRALGYAGVADATDALPGPTEDTGLPAPHERLEELAAYQRARALASEGRHEEACAVLRPLLADNPRNLYAYDQLGASLAKLARWDEVVEVLTRRLPLGRPQAATHVNLGAALESLGRAQEAEAHYRRALELDPGHPTARANLERLAGPR